MTDIIKLPASASRNDFAPFVLEDEVHAHISTAISGAQHIAAAPGLYMPGQAVVAFAAVLEGGRRSSVHVGWRKVAVGRISGTGRAYEKNGQMLVNYYIGA